MLDAAEFCRNVHTDAEWRAQAQAVCIDLGGYVQQLNTHYGIYSALATALREQQQQAGAAAAAGGGGNGGASAAAAAGGAGVRAAGDEGWTPEALLVGRMLQRDFERYGVHLSGTAPTLLLACHLVAGACVVAVAFAGCLLRSNSR